MKPEFRLVPEFVRMTRGATQLHASCIFGDCVLCGGTGKTWRSYAWRWWFRFFGARSQRCSRCDGVGAVIEFLGNEGSGLLN